MCLSPPCPCLASDNKPFRPPAASPPARQAASPPIRYAARPRGRKAPAALFLTAEHHQAGAGEGEAHARRLDAQQRNLRAGEGGAGGSGIGVGVESGEWETWLAGSTEASACWGPRLPCGDIAPYHHNHGTPPSRHPTPTMTAPPQPAHAHLDVLLLLELLSQPVAVLAGRVAVDADVLEAELLDLREVRRGEVR